MYQPAFGPFHQIAWVTNDIDRSLTLYREVYGIPHFLVMDQEFNARVGTEHGRMKLKIALANVDNVQIELIEPRSPGIDGMYRDVLPKDGRYANVFHHVCVKINGTLDDWEKHLAGLHRDRNVYFEGDIGPGGRVVYTDERPFIGHYIEHVWFGPEIEQHMKTAVPHFFTGK